MSETIRLTNTTISGNKIDFSFSVSDGLKQFFLETPFFLEYFLDNKPMIMEKVPKSICNIPFVCNLLPIIWITDSVLEVPELDEDFFNCIEKIKNGYVKMYPKVKFGGEVKVAHLKKNTGNKKQRSAVFYSGGVDSWCTLARHIEESPDLISIWGSDVAWDNEKAWKVLCNTLEESTKGFDLAHIVVRSTFRKTIYEDCLTWTFDKQLNDNWWHGMQHGIAIISHAAPCNYVRGVSMQYIAATYAKEDVICASHPWIDNAVKFFDCKVSHDAFITRQQKIKEIITFCQERNIKIKMHVCWESTGGENCCACEKCCRTIYGLLVDGADELDSYGFEQDKINFKKVKKFLKKAQLDDMTKTLWVQIREEFIKNKKQLCRKKYYKHIKWLERYKF